MKKKFIILLAILCLVAAGVYVVLSQNKASEDGVVTVYGNVEIREVDLGFRVSGRIADVLKDEGDQVEADTLLAKIDFEPLKHQLDSLVAQKQAAQASYALLVNGYRQEDVEQAKANWEYCSAVYDEAVTELKRQEQLQKADAGRKQDHDRASYALDQAKAKLSVAKAAYDEAVNGFRSEDVEKADALIDQLDAEIAGIQLQLKDTQLKAPSAGTILTRAIEKGSMVSVGQTAFTITLDNEVWVRAYIPQDRLGDIEPGMPVSVFSDSRPEHPYQGHVGFISSKAEFTPKYVETEDLRSDLVYRFRVLVDDDVQGLRQGMPVTVKLFAER
jgi:HlyD family secretion protein